jgi:hypothetical protein
MYLKFYSQISYQQNVEIHTSLCSSNFYLTEILLITE